jgi:hypothetical protein
MERIDNIDVLFHESPSKSTNHPLYEGFIREDVILKKGSIMRDGALALPCDILWQRDLQMRLRDGTTLYLDVYRPPHTTDTLPSIIASGGFGKTGGVNRDVMNKSPWRSGVPQKMVSGLEKFEGPDPAYWCLHGYVIVHPGRLSWFMLRRLRGNILICLCYQIPEDRGCLKEIPMSTVPWTGKMAMI